MTKGAIIWYIWFWVPFNSNVCKLWTLYNVDDIFFYIQLLPFPPPELLRCLFYCNIGFHYFTNLKLTSNLPGHCKQNQSSNLSWHLSMVNNTNVDKLFQLSFVIFWEMLVSIKNQTMAFDFKFKLFLRQTIELFVKWLANSGPWEPPKNVIPPWMNFQSLISQSLKNHSNTIHAVFFKIKGEKKRLQKARRSSPGNLYIVKYQISMACKTVWEHEDQLHWDQNPMIILLLLLLLYHYSCLSLSLM